jgi:hypothetical protein
VAQEASANLTQFLTEHVGLKPLEVAAVERGETVVRALDTSDKGDIAIFGIVAVDTQTHFGLFGTPAATADIETYAPSWTRQRRAPRRRSRNRDMA